jgi:glycosyltransferase involved in cell wall biosynthesis
VTSSETEKFVSAIVVVGQRNDDLGALAREYWDALGSANLPFELIFVLDGPKPDATQALVQAREAGIDAKIVRLSRPFGESTALMSGFDLARGDIVVTLPAYYQIESTSLPELIHELGESDMVVAKREPRRGGGFERMRRRAFHGLIRRITRTHFSDLGCGVRVMTRNVLEELRLYGDQHRFLAVLASHAGFKVQEVPAPQSENDYFRSKYRVREYLHRLLDIFTVFFLIRFTKKPLRFFGMIGGVIFLVGGLILGILVFQRMFLDVALADRPAMLLSSLLVVLGLQLFSLGLLGELIIFTHARTLKEYKIDQIIGANDADDIPESKDERSVA